MSVSSRIKHAKAWRERLCNQCSHFSHVPFTVGRCGRHGEYCAPSITVERAPREKLIDIEGRRRCGPTGYWFSPSLRERRTA